jgi:O-antigen/teichoic acid export membrane protein
VDSSPPVERSSFRRVIGGFLLLSAGTAFGQLIGFIALAVTARRVGPTELGAYTFAYGFAVYFMLPINTGLGFRALRETAVNASSTRQVVAEVVVLQTVVTVVSYAVLLLLSGLLIPGNASRSLLPIAALTVLIQATTFDWLVQARQDYSLLSAARLFGQVVFGLIVVVLVTKGFAGVRWYAWANAIGVAITAAILTYALRRAGLPGRRLHLTRASLLARFRASVPFGVVLTLNQIYYSIDSTILGYIKGSTAVGEYGVAYKIPLALIAFVNVWNNTLYAHASTLVLRDPPAVRRQISTSIAAALALGVPMICGTAFLGRGLMTKLFGPQYAAAGPAFSILIGATAVYMVWANLSAVLVAADRQRDYVRAVFAGTLFNVPVNLIVIPLFGLEGAAAVTVVTEVIITAYLWTAARRLIGSPTIDIDRLGRVVLATAGMAVSLVLTSGWEIFARLLFAIVVYGAVASALRVVTVRELKALRGGEAAADGAPATPPAPVLHSSASTPALTTMHGVPGEDDPRSFPPLRLTPQNGWKRSWRRLFRR